MSRLSAKSRRQLAQRLRMALSSLERGGIRVNGPGHSLTSTRARLAARIAELEEEAG